ncbi:MAG: hypothetical protein ABR601_07250 [Parasphingopyxis sp.]|nr:hypothetical protein [Sphingomonadales bacterium]
MMAALIVIAVILTVPAQNMQQDWGAGMNVPVFLVDLALMIGLYLLAMHSRRYWPLWVAGFHLITMTTHLATLAAPTYAVKVYFGLATFWAVPELLIIAFGVELDRRAGIRDHELDPPRRAE